MKFSVLEKDDCIGQYRVYQYTFAHPCTHHHCTILSIYGTLRVFTTFPKPYFHIKASDILIKGIVGEPTIETTFFDYQENVLQEKFEKFIMKQL